MKDKIACYVEEVILKHINTHAKCKCKV